MLRSLHRSTRHVGFTLIELLVVIAIIAVLAALLLPVLRSARQSANNTACISNLKQIGAGIQLYAVDHEGRLPTTGFYGVSPYYNRDPRAINFSLQTQLSLPTPTTWSTSNLELMSYAKVFACPGYQGAVNGKPYVLNKEIVLEDGSKLKPWGVMISATGTASPPALKIVQLTDLELSKTWAMRDLDFSTDKPNHPTHRNALFFDLHVGRLDFNDNVL